MGGRSGWVTGRKAWSKGKRLDVRPLQLFLLSSLSLADRLCCDDEASHTDTHCAAHFPRSVRSQNLFESSSASTYVPFRVSVCLCKQKKPTRASQSDCKLHPLELRIPIHMGVFFCFGERSSLVESLWNPPLPLSFGQLLSSSTLWESWKLSLWSSARWDGLLWSVREGEAR